MLSFFFAQIVFLCSDSAKLSGRREGSITMIRACFTTIAVATTAYYLSVPGTAMAAEGKCTSIQAQCAVEMGGTCNPKTGYWCYGFWRGRQCGGTHNGGAFDACISRKLAGRK
jgi:hypothetical protein